jgi:ATP-dependent Lon protease
MLSPERTTELELPRNLAILPSRDAVLYPGMLLPLQIAEQPWVQVLNDAVSARQPIGLFLQLTPDAEMHTVGTAANIVRLLEVTQREPYQRADIHVLDAPTAAPPAEAGAAEPSPDGQQPMEVEALIRNLQTLFRRLVQLSPVLPDEMSIAADNMDDPGRLADFVAANTDLEPARRQEILEAIEPLARARRVTELATREIEVLEIGSRIQSQIRETMDKSQREFYLRQQLQAIRKELGETDETEGALAGLRERLDKAGLPDEAKREAQR